MLVEAGGHVRTRERLVEAYPKPKTNNGYHAIDTHIRAIRRKLGERANLIQTIRTVGYRINESSYPAVAAFI